MAEERFEDRTEAATPRRRREARERGHVARSADLTAAVVLLAAVLALEFFGRRLTESLFGATGSVLGRLAEVDGSRESLMIQVGGACTAALVAFVPLALAVFVAAVGVNLAQVGFLFSGEPLAPRLERIDPFAGFARIFSARSSARLLSGLLKVLAVALVVAVTLWAERSRLAGLAGRAFEDILKYGTGIMLTLAFRAVLALVFLAVLHYGYERWQYERDLRMSRQEIREELRRFEGDPRIKDRRRSIQRRLAVQRMMHSVSRATVVITNPTRLAVAIEYRRDEMEAPVVVAKGVEHHDRRIREIALEHGVPIVERTDLARAVYRKVDVGQPVPAELYQAVAEVLAYVVRLKGPASVA